VAIINKMLLSCCGCGVDVGIKITLRENGIVQFNIPDTWLSRWDSLAQQHKYFCEKCKKLYAKKEEDS
jgi:hypothetical protein